MKRRVLVVDDHPVVRQGLMLLINQDPDLKVCAEAGNATDAMEAIRREKPHIAVVDISLDGVSGLELIRQIRAEFSAMPILVFSIHEEQLYAERVLRAGAQGYLVKQEATDKVVAAIHRILRGEVVVCERMIGPLLQRYSGRPAERSQGVDCLSDRELEIYRMVGVGRKTREIAESLGVSVKTVESHRENIKRKLNLADSADLIRHAVRWIQVKEFENR